MKKEQISIYPSFTQAIFLLVLFVLSTLVIFVIQRGLFTESSETSLFKLWRTLGAMSFVIVYLISKKSFKFLTSSFRKVDTEICLWMFPIGFLFFFFMWGIAFIILMLFSEPDLGVYSSPHAVHIYTFISIACITPLFEELLFRGIILNSFLQRYRFFKAMFLSVVLFVLLHAGLQMLTAAFLGMLTGYIYYVTKSIWPGVILHGINNSFAFLSLYFINNMNLSFSSNIIQSTEKTLFIIGLLWVVIAIVFISILYYFFLLLRSKYNIQ